jgi:hypothetical protein
MGLRSNRKIWSGLIHNLLRGENNKRMKSALLTTALPSPYSPGNDKKSNWLPAPKDGDFSLYVRAYWPKVAITDGSWTPPPVQLVN